MNKLKADYAEVRRKLQESLEKFNEDINKAHKKKMTSEIIERLTKKRNNFISENSLLKSQLSEQSKSTSDFCLIQASRSK